MDGWTKHSGGWRAKTLEYDTDLKRHTVYWFNEDTNKQKLVEHWDTSDLIEENKALYAQTDERAGWKGDMHLVGRIPISIANDVLKKTGWGKDRKAVSKWLTDPDNQFFLTRPIRKGI